MTTPIQSPPRPPWRGTRLAEWVRGGQRALGARRYVRNHNRALPPDAPVLSFYPMLPTNRLHIRKILTLLGMRIGSSPESGGLTIAWDTGTRFRRGAADRLPPNAINRYCLDISKSLVDRNWAAAAGYSISVDPLTFQGRMVVKSERNGGHDGRVVTGPLGHRRDGFVYQRYVDAVEDGEIAELRTSVIGNAIPVVMQKWRPASNWRSFSSHAAVRTAEEIYSAAEIEQLLAFAQLMHLDYGEMDVLRDRASGRIYVLDANRTPYGPARVLPPADAARAAQLMSEAFARLLASRT